MRLTKAPVIRAGVMIANIIWKAINTNSGIFPLPTNAVSGVIPFKKLFSKFPIIPAKSVPSAKEPLKQNEYPTINQSTVDQPNDTKL